VGRARGWLFRGWTLCVKRGMVSWRQSGGHDGCAHCDGDVTFAVIAARDGTWEYGAIHNWRDKSYSGIGGVDSPMVALERPGLAGDGTGVGGTSVGAGVRNRLGWMRGGWRAVGGDGGGLAVVGGGDGWLEGDKSVNDQATFSNNQHPSTTLNRSSSTPIPVRIHATKVPSQFSTDMDQVVMAGYHSKVHA
jgi:hypothetical protein